MEGKPYGRVWQHKDITETKKAEEKINNLLTEKEIILKEVHHRMKNNMHMVKSLLSLQIGATKNPSVINALRDAESRVQCMMILYEKLFLSKGYTNASVRNYLSSLIDEVIVIFPNRGSVKTEKNIHDFELEAKKLQSVGIIINELLTNIMKYAFTGRDDGLITVSSSLSEGKASFIIEDNGNGIPESIDFGNTSGFGLSLVKIMTGQLAGSIRIERIKGTRIVLEFDI
jgi:two-component sensor histidine kinase